MTNKMQKKFNKNIEEIIKYELECCDTQEEKDEYLENVRDADSSEFEDVVNQLISDYGWAYGDWENNLDDELEYVIDEIADSFIND